MAPVRVDFIAGMPRSGTTWLGRALASHPDVAVFGETSFFGRLYVEPRPDGTYGASDLARVRSIQRQQEWCATTGDESTCLRNSRPEDYAALVDAAFGELRAPVTPGEAFSKLAGAVTRSEDKPRAAEKTPHHVHWLPRIAAAFPDARFVLLTRDPYGFMLSLEHLGSRIESPLRRVLDRPWRHPLIAALAWRCYMLSVERARTRFADRILVVDHEDVRERPGELLEAVQSFLGVEVRELATNAQGRNSSFLGRTRPVPRGQDAFWLNLVARGVMRRNGYRPEPTRLRPLPILVSVVTLPFCLAFAAVGLPRRVPGSFRSYLAGWLGL
jgi:hypothetical protein